MGLSIVYSRALAGLEAPLVRVETHLSNGLPAFGQYKPGPDGGRVPWALQVLEMSNGRITGLNFFLDTERLFPLFGLPLTHGE